jgi:hypothetical protein
MNNIHLAGIFTDGAWAFRISLYKFRSAKWKPATIGQVYIVREQFKTEIPEHKRSGIGSCDGKLFSGISASACKQAVKYIQEAGLPSLHTLKSRLR